MALGAAQSQLRPHAVWWRSGGGDGEPNVEPNVEVWGGGSTAKAAGSLPRCSDWLRTGMSAISRLSGEIHLIFPQLTGLSGSMPAAGTSVSKEMGTEHPCCLPAGNIKQ